MPKKTNPQSPAKPPAAQPAGQLVYVTPAQLKIHPHNMRRFYPRDDVRKIADSIRANGGVLQPLQITPNGEAGCYYVVDGNLRTQAAQLLGAECPPLKAEVHTDSTVVDQMLAMVVHNTHRFDVDPVSEGLHYAALRAEGLTLSEICERTGQYYARVSGRLKLTQLDESIQQLIADGLLPHHQNAVDALLSVPARARVPLAQKLAERGAGVKTIVAACARAVQEMGTRATPPTRTRRLVETSGPDVSDSPMLARAQALAGQHPDPGISVAAADVRAAAREMCAVCEVNADELQARFPEPAWTLISASAAKVCDDCNLRRLERFCAACPGVQVLRHMLAGARLQSGRAVGHA